MGTNVASQRQLLLMKRHICNVETSGSRGHSQYHETFHKRSPFQIDVKQGYSINELSSGFQLISQIIVQGSKTLLNGSNLVSRIQLEKVLFKVMLIFFIHSLIKRNYSLELHLLATAIFHWEVSSATISPTPSYSSAVASIHRDTPSLSTFQSTITNDYLPRTLNSSIRASRGNKAISQTANFQISMPVTDTKLAHLQGTCDDDWIHYEDLCYRVVTETKVFNHAERFCVIHSAHLISIESKEENDKIFNLVETSIGQPGKIRIWLGMERVSSDSRLHWVDNKPLSFENWAPGEPDQTGACVQMIHKGWWEDTSCTQLLPFICKKGKSDLETFFMKDCALGASLGVK